MYRIEWTSQAFLDLKRFYDFLTPINFQTAVQTINTLATIPEKLTENPRIGERLPEFLPCEVRKLLIGRYELRYEIRESTIYVLKLFHVREKR